MSRTYVTYQKLVNMKCQQCSKLYVKPQCLQNHIILKHSISISVPSPEGNTTLVEPGGNSRTVFRQVQNIPHIRPQISVQKSENFALKHSMPSTSNSISDPVSPQRKGMQSNPLFDIDVLELVEWKPSDTQQNWESVIKNGSVTDNQGVLPVHSQEQEVPFNDNPFLDALDGIDFDGKENAEILDNVNNTYSDPSDQMQPSRKISDQPLALPEEDSLLISNVNYFEDLLTFE